MGRVVLLALAAGILWAGARPASAQDYSTAILVLPDCKVGAGKSRPKDFVQAAQYGRCLGTIETILGLHSVLSGPARFCRPATVSLEQGRLVVVKYGDLHPELLHLPFAKLAIAAFREVWPCE